MLPRRFLLSFLVAGVLAAAAHAADLVEQTWTVDGVQRTALVHWPAKTDRPVPVVFAFHGHGGSSRNASRSFPIHEKWPEAIVVYPQGLPTVGKLTDPKGERAGWLTQADPDENRDLKFFDIMLAEILSKKGGDPRRVYAMGHSNGGGFTYLLWAERGDAFAAVAPSAALIMKGAAKLRPKPAMHLGSPSDELVKFAWQARMIDRVLSVNGCPPRDPAAKGLREYPSSKGSPVLVYLHDGGHKFPTAATVEIVKFFQAQARP
jgi:polyhydroxybutyrate depolymerase